VRSLSILIPAYNECETIESIVSDALRVGDELSPAIEVVVCNDGSSDGTGEKLDEIAARDPRVRPLHRLRNRGIEASIRALYAAAEHDFAFLISADGQWPMESLHPMAEKIQQGADLVVGTRANKSSVYTPYRRWVSGCYERIARAFGSPVRDPGSIKLGRTEAFRVPVAAVGVFSEAERLIRAARSGFRVVETPVEFHARRSGKATGAKPQVVLRAATDVLRVGSSLLSGWPPPRAPECDVFEAAGSAARSKPHGLAQRVLAPLLDRRVTNAVRYLLDDWLPPVVRELRPLNRFLANAFHGRDFDLDFKQKAFSMASGEFKATYERLGAGAGRYRDCDTTPAQVEAIVDAIVGTRVLEVGCGNGMLTQRLLDSGIDVVPVDVAMPFLQATRERDPERGKPVLAALPQLPFADGVFDTVVCAHTLEHIPRLHESVQELRRVGAQRLVIVVPRQRYYRYTIDYHLHFFPSAAPLAHLVEGMVRPVDGDWFCLTSL
jgi:glycosyltransferase involved in cell wall biosynthesis/ubiquinone/menaquinone biosynthesis C-methylase UbiE